MWLRVKSRPLLPSNVVAGTGTVFVRRLHPPYVACGSANADVVRIHNNTGPRNFDAPAGLVDVADVKACHHSSPRTQDDSLVIDGDCVEMRLRAIPRILDAWLS